MAPLTLLILPSPRLLTTTVLVLTVLTPVLTLAVDPITPTATKYSQSYPYITLIEGREIHKYINTGTCTNFNLLTVTDITYSYFYSHYSNLWFYYKYTKRRRNMHLL